MKTEFNELYKKLNPEQKKAVDTIDGPVFVMAGPGTGKTQILTLRIANILRQSDIDPENILALTFTNAAAYNMRERLSGIVGPESAHRVYISTFHSFAEDMIKRYGEYFPERIGFRLVSPVEQIEVIETILDSLQTQYFSAFRRRESTTSAVSFALGKIKGEGLNPDEFRKHTLDQFDIDREHPDMFYKRKYGEFQAGDVKPGELRKLERARDKNLELADIYERYQETLQNKHLYDFSDVIIDCVAKIKDPESLFKTELQEQFQYILVDEHQDTNDAQNAIIHGLIDNPVWEGAPNLFVVGDSKQAIFRFAGASQESYTRLLNNLHNPEIINLKQNYRSGQAVLDHAHELITQSDNHNSEPELQAFFEHDAAVYYRQFQNYKLESLWVAQDIKQSIADGAHPNDIAVLYRNNSDVTELRRLCDVLGIPYRDFSKKNILKDTDMLKLFLLLRVIHNPFDNPSLAKVLFIDFLDFDVFDVQKILLKSKNAKGEYNKAIISIISDKGSLDQLDIPKDRAEKITHFAQILKEQKSKSENIDFVSFFSNCIREIGFLNYILSQDNSVFGLTKIEKLFDEIKKESQSRTNFGFDDFITYLSTLQKHNITMNVTNTVSDGVQLMTFHGSKGLEFERVYILSALQKHKMGREISLPFNDFSDGETDDERRLFYVALTRAKKECHISSYIYNEEGREKNKSLHINEMPNITSVDVSDWEQEHIADVALFFNESNEHIVSLLDAEYIKERFFNAKLSVSALNNYMESPLKYFFRNLVALPESRSIYLDFGNVMHETLEHYFNKVKKEQKILNKEELQNSFEYIINNNHLYEEYKDRGWTILNAYYDEYRDNLEVPIENELRVPMLELELANGYTVRLTGVVDKITRDDEGTITVWDYKTGKTYGLMDKDRREKIKRQAAFYKLLLQNYQNGKYNFHTATFDFLEINEEKGIYERQSFDITQDDVDAVVVDITKLVDDIVNGTLLEKDFYADKKNNGDLLEFLEVLKGPVTKEQLPLFE